MINYTERLTLLMQDIVVAGADAVVHRHRRRARVRARSDARTPKARSRRAIASASRRASLAITSGAIARRGKLTRRSEWFVTKSPVGDASAGREIKYMISFALPRFCDQSLDRSRKERFYPGAPTVDGEARHGRARALSHRSRARRHPPHRARRRHLLGELPRAPLLRAGGGDGAHLSRLDSRIPRCCDFLREDFDALAARHGGVVGGSFRTFPSFPQRYIERLADQPPCESDADGVKVEPLRVAHNPTRYTEDDLHVREFTKETSRRLIRKGKFRAA